MNAVQELAGCFPFLSTSKQKTKQTQTTETAQGAAPNNNKKTHQQRWPTGPPQIKWIDSVVNQCWANGLYMKWKMLVEFKFNSLDSLPHKDFFPFNFQYEQTTRTACNLQQAKRLLKSRSLGTPVPEVLSTWPAEEQSRIGIIYTLDIEGSTPRRRCKWYSRLRLFARLLWTVKIIKVS